MATGVRATVTTKDATATTTPVTTTRPLDVRGLAGREVPLHDHRRRPGVQLELLGGTEAAATVEGQGGLVVPGDHGVPLDLPPGDDGVDEPEHQLAAQALALAPGVDRHGQHLGPPPHARAGGRPVPQGLEHAAPGAEQRTDGPEDGTHPVVEQELAVQAAGRVGTGDVPDDRSGTGGVAPLDGHEEEAAVPQHDPAVEPLEEPGTEAGQEPGGDLLGVEPRRHRRLLERADPDQVGGPGRVVTGHRGPPPVRGRRRPRSRTGLAAWWSPWSNAPNLSDGQWAPGPPTSAGSGALSPRAHGATSDAPVYDADPIAGG